MKQRTLTLAITSALLGMTAQVQAAGFQLAEYSATGLGRAYAGEAAMADNASAQFRNPAMLTYLKGTQVSAGGILVVPNIDIKGHTVPVGLDGKPTGAPVATQAKDIADAAFVPNFYVSHQLNDQWVVGLAMGTNFGMATELDDSFLGTQFGNEAAVTTVEFNPNIAYRMNDQLSIGWGLRLVYGEGSIGAKSSADVPTFNVQAGDTLKYMEGDDIAWGWQLGGAWQINADNRIGVNYRSAVDLNLEGHANGFAFNLAAREMGLAPQAEYAGSMELTLPATAEIASFHQLTDKFAMHASINWTDWSSFEKLEAQIPYLVAQPEQLVKQENWRDNYRFAIGGTYQLDAKSVLRAGVAYDKSAVTDANRTLTIPEMDRYWFSVGYGYEYSDNLTFDAGLTYILADESPVTEPRPGIESDKSAALFGGAFTGTTSGDLVLFGVQASYKF
ncbi:MAG: outer membrane protein transport protein [Shewanella sp.]|nr:outer membrane protein transport protein [Shewanella sp.]MCF1429939.1 outer membrane protein transport protein [Shewanella sp.]MCF1437667.1 outer membrane protein transport protein [Shewanella sp.]MCF1456746.1 outer membrane protein transport protein [Shewanella sp.]